MGFANKNNRRAIVVSALAALLLHGCATDRSARKASERAEQFEVDPLFDPAEKEARAEAEEAREPAPAGEDADTEPATVATRVSPGPEAPDFEVTLDQEEMAALEEELEGPPISLDVNNLPLPVFINEVFGEKLGLSYSLAPSLSERTDLVTLRLSETLPPADLFRTARSVLAEYGVGVTRQEGVWLFGLSDDIATDGTPLLITGETLPEVPASHRPVFRIMELGVVRNTQVRALVQDLFKGRKVEVSEDAMRNAIILRGPADQVAAAAEAVRFFDRPLMKGRHSLILRPVFRNITALSDALKNLLSAQGYAVGNPAGASGSIILLPMEEMEVLIALANDEATLKHVENWARELDRSYQEDIDSGMFVYEVRNTSAAHLANMITQLYTGEGFAPGRRDREDGETNQTQQQEGLQGGAGGPYDTDLSERDAGATITSSEIADGRLVVDERRNVLIFRGAGRTWMELKTMMEELDKQVPTVLMEVLLAEVTLNDNQNVGVEWLINNASLGGDFSGTFGTLGGLDIGGRGFSFTLDNAGQTRAVLNAFYNSNQAVIRSSPKIMVKSGETARIEVGNEIPILTSTRQNQFQTGGDTDVLQQFEFRKTGVDLTVEPIVQASGLVDIRLAQNLSESQSTGTNFLPNILNRRVETSLTLRDGGSVVLGGLISRSRSEGTQGIPWLSKIPVLGKLFSTETDSTSRTELMIMVVPYVIRNDSEASEVSERLRERLRDSAAGPGRL